MNNKREALVHELGMKLLAFKIDFKYFLKPY